MKLLITVAVLFFVYTNCAALTPEEEEQVWADYLNKFNIRLGRSQSVDRVKRTVIDRYLAVEEHNKDFSEGKVPYELALNEFSYLTYDELVQQRTGSSETNETGIPYVPELKRARAAATDENFSWLNTPDVVQAVQNQGSCGSCWAFAALGAIEGQLKLNKKMKVKLSEQEVIECVRNQWTGNLLGCNGGWHFAAYDFARDKNGLTYQSTKPYRGNTYTACNPSTNRVTQAKTASYVEIQNRDENAMREALRNKGPLYVTFHVSNDFASYRSGVYTDRYNLCSGKSNNHGVLLVGYGKQNGVLYWLIKNSWGTGFGESGYFKIERGRNVCGIANTVNYPTLA